MLKDKEFISTSVEETKKFAKDFIKKLDSRCIISLEGELGGGKTTFVQGLAFGLGIKKKIKSPTFVIIKKYDIKFKIQNAKCKNKNQNLKLSKFKTLYHFDCYRIGNSREILELGWKKIIGNSKNIVLVEWGDKIKDILPKNTLHIKFKFVDKNKRKITISSY